MYKISGPVNVTRLHGNVGNTNKTIYLFMDEHHTLKYQTQCNNANSKQIVDYIYNAFIDLNNSDKMYDFFVEFQPAYLLAAVDSQWFNREIYLDKVLRFFKKYMVYNPHDNVVRASRVFKNIRFHYIDIRDWMEYFIFESTTQILKSTKNAEPAIKAQLKKIVYYFDIAISQLRVLKSLFENPTNVREPNIIITNLPPLSEGLKFNVMQQIIQKLKYLIDKLSRRYHHHNVKSNVNKFIKNILVPEFDVVINTMIALRDYAKNAIGNPKNNILASIRRKLIDAQENVMIPMFALIMDMYFIRRFLDKDYITNAIVYVGSAHAAMYIDILVNLFDFKVTHTTSNITTNIQQINASVKKYHPFNSNLHFFNITDQILNILLPTNAQSLQCSDISKFPREFK